MSHISSDFANINIKIKVSALQKASRISPLVDKVTIGPAATLADKSSWSENRENEKNSSNTEDATSNTGENADLSARPRITFSQKKILVEKEKLVREDVRRKMEQRVQDMTKSTQESYEKLETIRAMVAIKQEKDKTEELMRLEAEEQQLAQQDEIHRQQEQQLQAQRIRERKEKREREVEENRRSREREELVNRLTPLRTSIREKFRDIGNISGACKDRNLAAIIFTPLAAKMKELRQQMEAIYERTRTGNISATDVAIAENFVRQSDEVLNACKSEVARIDALYEQEVARRENEMKQAQEAHAQAEAAQLSEANNVVHTQLPQEQTPQTPESSPIHKQEAPSIQPAIPLPVTPPNEENSVNPEPGLSATDSSSVETAKDDNNSTSNDFQSLKAYMDIHVFLTNHAASYQHLTQAASMKKFRFELQKAINIPVNAISKVHGPHLKDKYDTLRNLLTGKSTLNVTQHPQGVAFCKDVLAKKIVSQGETLISSKPEMAFPVAAVALALWNDLPDFGQLLLAHFRCRCPYILPVFLPRLQDQTNEEYYKSLGYKYTEDGVVEKQDKYLNRISGLMRLYASIIVSKQRRGVNVPHPHGIEHAWRWLSVTLNNEARPDLSDVIATLILDMLEVAGNALSLAYPRQFPKLLILLATQYYPQMQNEAGIGGGPMARLELFLKEWISKKSIPPPEGELPPNFW